MKIFAKFINDAVSNVTGAGDGEPPTSGTTKEDDQMILGELQLAELAQEWESLPAVVRDSDRFNFTDYKREPLKYGDLEKWLED